MELSDTNGYKPKFRLLSVPGVKLGHMSARQIRRLKAKELKEAKGQEKHKVT
jgi:hypothetical protein